MGEQIIKYNNIDIDNIELSDPKKIGNIYYSHISYNDNPFFLQTSRMKNIIDIKELDLRKPFDLKFELDNSDMYNCLNKLDENNINKISENSFYWFGKNINIEHVSTHGGSLRVFISKKDSDRFVQKNQIYFFVYQFLKFLKLFWEYHIFLHSFYRSLNHISILLNYHHIQYF